MGLLTHLPIRQVFRHARRLRAGEKCPARSSLCLARQRLGVEPVQHLHAAVVHPLATPDTPGAFLAQDGDQRLFCYANTNLRKRQQDDELLELAKYWKNRTGKLPAELLFDSKLTTHANLSRLNQPGIDFITLRRGGPKLLEELQRRPRGAGFGDINLRVPWRGRRLQFVFG